MAVLSRAVTVATTATRLDSTTDAASGGADAGFAVHNTSAVTVYLGGSDVTTANGAPVAAGAWGPGMELAPSDGVFGIVASGTAEVRILEVGV